MPKSSVAWKISIRAASSQFLTTKFSAGSLPQSNERQAGPVASRSRRRGRGGGSLVPRAQCRNCRKIRRRNQASYRNNPGSTATLASRISQYAKSQAPLLSIPRRLPRVGSDHRNLSYRARTPPSRVLEGKSVATLVLFRPLNPHPVKRSVNEEERNQKERRGQNMRQVPASLSRQLHRQLHSQQSK